MKVTSPSGSPIIGTNDLVRATAYIEDGSFRFLDGKLDFEFIGDSDVDWDSQSTTRINGERTFVDEEGDVWLESQLIITEDT